MEETGTGSSAASYSNVMGSSQSDALKRNSGDIGWEYGELMDPKNPDKVKCKLCGKSISGGVNRLKQHVAGIKGNVTSCPKSTPLDKSRIKEALEGAKKKKTNKKQQSEGVREEVNISEKESEDLFDVDSFGNKAPHTLGPMDTFTRAINPDSPIESRKRKRQQNINDALFKSRSDEVHSYLARWVYESGIPFNAINNESFCRFVEVVGQFGPGYIPPSQYQLREPLLKLEVERTRESLKVQEEEWKKSGCSIMTDAWPDRKRRSIMNLCVNCKLGTSFLSSVEASDVAHTGEYIFEYVDKCIEDVGPQNVVQVVTDNASNNMVAAKLLKEKRPNIFWSSCATHTINLILEGIGKLPKFKGVIEKAKSLTHFIYAHHKTLAMMRKYTKKRDIVRPGVTRFASSFLTMESILEKKESLKFMFGSEEWDNSKWKKSAKGARAESIIFNSNFWTNLSWCIEIFKPLVKVLRLVDGDAKPAMGFVYGELKDAKKEIIKICKDVEATYKPILEIIDLKSEGRLDSALHLTGYLLNPYYFYRDDEVQDDPNCMEALATVLEAFFPGDLEKQNLILNEELMVYREMTGMFSNPHAIVARSKNNDDFRPVHWWGNWGGRTPNLRNIARKILSLTTSSSGCERTWSTFEGIHTKKRNRLDAERMNKLVYVQFNAKLANKKKKMDALLANDATMAQGWIVEGGEEEEEETSLGSGITWENVSREVGADELLGPRRSLRRDVRELDEEDFESDDEEINSAEIILDESDQEQEHW